METRHSLTVVQSSCLVRIRFRTPTPFGYTVYYLPKWGPVRCLFASPDRELREILESGSERGAYRDSPV